MLKNLAPAQVGYEIVKTMCADASSRCLERASQASVTLKRTLAGIETKIGGLLKRTLDASSPRITQEYEDKIMELEPQKLLTEDQVLQSASQTYRIRLSIVLAGKFLADPPALWNNNDLRGLITKRVVLRIAFYCRVGLFPKREHSKLTSS